MLFQTEGQLLFAIILFLCSSVLCVVALIINVFIKKLNKNKIKVVLNIIFDFVFTIIFTSGYIILSNIFNYGTIRLYSLIFYLLPIIFISFLIKNTKRQKVKNI